MNVADWQDKVIYHILIDRFAGYKYPENSEKPEFIGGNLQGIVKKLPYLKSLGINVLWLSPFVKGTAYHGYHITDFHAIDPRFGNEADMKILLTAAHAKGMKVICDFVPNHCSIQHAFFKDAQANPKSKYRNWFIFEKWPDRYRTFLSVPELAKLNLDYQPALEHIQRAARKWLDLGFDGLRVDHVVGLSNQNVKNIFEPLRKEFPESIFICEAWFLGTTYKELRTLRIPKKRLIWLLWKLGDKANGLLYKNYTGLMHGVLDFELMNKIEKYALADTKHEENKYRSKAIKQSEKFKGKLLQFSFLDNHDTERFLFRCNNEVERLEKAAKLQFDIKQPAIIYYGTEVGLTQVNSFASKGEYADLLARPPMEWDDKKQNKELVAFYKKLIHQKVQDR